MDRRYLAKIETSPKLQEINDMIWIAELSFCRDQHWKNERGQMLVYQDGEVVWSSFNQSNLLLGLTGSSEEEIGAFYEKYEKYEKKPLTSSPDIRWLNFRPCRTPPPR
jgi:hypothetical protein